MPPADPQARPAPLARRPILDEDLSPLGLVSQDPDTFLSELYADRYGTLVNVLEAISRRYKKPPLSIEALIDLLHGEVPRTMGLLAGVSF